MLAYNQYSGLSIMPYKIIAHLVENNEAIFKLLKYNIPDALDKPNLSTSEKTALIYNGEEDSSSFSIFMQSITDDAFPNMGTQFRVYINNVYPVDSIRGLVTFDIEIICHNKNNQLNNYTTRVHTLIEETIKSLNGISIDGIGELFFNAKASRNNNYARHNVYNGKNCFGYTVCFSTWCGNIDVNGC